MLSVDRLVDDLWGESPPATARHALQVYVSNLRKQLGKAVVGTEPPGYVLRLPAEACDAVRFETLTRSGRRALQEGNALEASRTLTAALALWTGPALADLASEPYAAQEALRLEEMRLVAAEDRISADLALGRHAELVGELEGRVALHPLRERLWALLMLAAYRSGRQVEALRAYQSVRERLRDDLGLDPGPELQELNAAILRQDASLAAPSLPLPVPAAPAPTPGPAHSASRPESRRVASVVVAGLIGFDRTAGTLDPEDLRTLLDRCMTRLTQVVARYGGTVAACGLASGMDLPASVAPFILRGVTLAGVDSVMAPRERRLRAWERLAQDLDPAALDTLTATRPLADAPSVATDILAGKVRGRVVLTV